MLISLAQLSFREMGKPGWFFYVESIFLLHANMYIRWSTFKMCCIRVKGNGSLVVLTMVLLISKQLSLVSKNFPTYLLDHTQNNSKKSTVYLWVWGYLGML